MYEAEINIIIHSLGGKFTVRIYTDYIRVTASDRGPGIADIEQAMREGYSTASAKVREMGFGAGMGLPNIKRCSDRFNITSSPGGSTEITFEIDFNV
jgi:anti-sigma regulatory factor (Ser/Thr protein kinase)